jgi:hypothetical protein
VRYDPIWVVRRQRVKGSWRERVGANCRLLDMDEGLLENTTVNCKTTELFFFNFSTPVYNM